MSTTAPVVDVAVKNAPAAAVVGVGFMDWFQALPVSAILQWATLAWVLIQASCYIYDRFKGPKHGCDK